MSTIRAKRILGHPVQSLKLKQLQHIYIKRAQNLYFNWRHYS